MAERQNDLEVLAHHEAGHLLAGHLFGMKISAASIVPEPEKQSAAHIEFNATALLESHGMFNLQFAKIVSAFAGPAAQRRFAPRSNVAYRARTDHFEAQCDALNMSSSRAAANQILRAAKEEAKALIDLHWPEVQFIARNLVQRKTMTSSDVATLLKPMEAARRAVITKERARRAGLSGEQRVKEDTAYIEEKRRSRNVRRRDVADAILDVMIDSLAAREFGGLDCLHSSVVRLLTDRGFHLVNASSALNGLIKARKPVAAWRATKER